MKKISFILIVFLSQSSVFARESFFDPSVVNTEEEFLIEQGKELNKYQKKIDYYSRQNICGDSCKRNLEILKSNKMRSYRKSKHASILVREELSGRLWQCVDELRSEEIFPCFEAEMNYLNNIQSCNERTSGFSSSKSKSCLLKSKNELESIYSTNKICKKNKYLLGTDRMYRLNSYMPYYQAFSESPERSVKQNNFLKKFYKCVNDQYHAAKRFEFNPKINDFLVGSKKTKYLNLLNEESTLDYIIQKGEQERKLFYLYPDGLYIIRFYNSIYEERLTGSEKFIKNMIPKTRFNEFVTDVERAKKHFQRTVPISSPDDPIVFQSADKRRLGFLKHSYTLDSNGEYVSGYSRYKGTVKNEFLRYLPEFNEKGLVVWQNKDEGLIRWLKLDDKILGILDGYVHKLKESYVNKKNNVAIVVKNLIGESALIFTIRHDGNVYEYKVVKKNNGNKKIYAYEGEYEGIVTKEHKYQMKRQEIRKASRNDDMIKTSKIKISETSTLPDDQSKIVGEIKKQDTAQTDFKSNVEHDVKHNNSKNINKEISNVSVKNQGYQALINNCRVSVNNLDLEEIYTERTNSFLSMVDNLDKINCSSVEGKGCHSEEARKLIMKHYYLEKDSHQKARIWKDNSDHENAEECLRLYGFAR